MRFDTRELARTLHLRLLLTLLPLGFLLAACQEGSGGGLMGGTLAIRSFTADDAVVHSASGSTTLRWSLAGADGAVVRLVSSDGGERTVTGANQVQVTPNPSAASVTYTLTVTRGPSSAVQSLTIRFPTPTLLRGSLALDNLLDEAEADASTLQAPAMAPLSAGEQFRQELAELLPQVPVALRTAGAVDALALQRSERMINILSRIVAPTSLYAGEAVALVDAQGRVEALSRVAADGSWSLNVPRFGTFALLRGRFDGNNELVCYQPLEVEVRDARGRATAVQPLLVRSTVEAEELLGRFAMNEQSGHLSAVTTSVPVGVRIPDEIASFFQISDQVLACEHPSPAKLTVDARFEVDTADGTNAPGTLDFGNLWTTDYDESNAEDFETLASAAIGDDGENRTALHYNSNETVATLPLFHDTCLLNFDKCVERFADGAPILPFVAMDDLSIDSASLESGAVTVLRRNAKVQTATVNGRALNASGAPVRNALILVTNNDTANIGMGRSNSRGEFSIAVPLGGRNAFTAVSNIRGVGNGTMACGNACSFNSVRVFNGVDAANKSVDVVYR
jgi:hypothetical protein